jgi:hypothetical protein
MVLKTGYQQQYRNPLDTENKESLAEKSHKCSSSASKHMMQSSREQYRPYCFGTRVLIQNLLSISEKGKQIYN